MKNCQPHSTRSWLPDANQMSLLFETNELIHCQESDNRPVGLSRRNCHATQEILKRNYKVELRKGSLASLIIVGLKSF